MTRSTSTSGAGRPAAGDPAERAREICLRALERRMHSRRELELRLRRKGVDPDVAARVLDRLAEVGLVDDAAFARAYVASRQRRRPRGRRALAAELAGKGVDRETAETVLAELADAEDPAEAAVRALEARMRSYASEPPEAARRKALQFLIRRGFDYETAGRAVDRCFP